MLRRVCHSLAQDYQPALRSSRRRTYTAARFNLQLLLALVPGSAAALLISRRNLIFQQPASILNNLARLIQLV